MENVVKVTEDHNSKLAVMHEYDIHQGSDYAPLQSKTYLNGISNCFLSKFSNWKARQTFTNTLVTFLWGLLWLVGS